MILDIVIVTVLLISAVIAFFRGFIKEVLTIFGLGGAALGAFLFGAKMAGPFESWLVKEDESNYKYFDIIPDDILALVLAYLAVFVVIFIVMTVLGHFISKAAQAMGLGPVDRSLGVLFGLVRGILLLGILYLPFSLIMEEEEFPEFVQQSRLIPVVDTVVDWGIDVAGLERPLEDAVPDEDNIKNSIDAIDRVREGYISGAAPEDAPSAEQGPGYEQQDRQALERLIEDDSANDEQDR